MAMCPVCRTEIPVYERRCQSCGSGVVRDADRLLANTPTDKELSRARLCHLLALPGMLVLGVLIETAIDRVGILAFVPLNLLVPFVFWLSTLNSQFVRSHGLEVFNFQLLWTFAMYLVWFSFHWLVVGLVNDLAWIFVYLLVLLGGIGLVLISSSDAASAGDGKYPIRIPIR